MAKNNKNSFLKKDKSVKETSERALAKQTQSTMQDEIKETLNPKIVKSGSALEAFKQKLKERQARAKAAQQPRI